MQIAYNRILKVLVRFLTMSLMVIMPTRKKVKLININLTNMANLLERQDKAQED